MRDTTEDLLLISVVRSQVNSLRTSIKDIQFLNFEYSQEKLTELKAALEYVANKATKLINKEREYAKHHTRGVADNQDQE